MLKTMLFIDYENFDISIATYCRENGIPQLRLNYKDFPKRLIKHISKELSLIKTLIFAPKPDSFLMQDEYYKNRYEWLDSLMNFNNLMIIEGSHIARPAPGLTKEQMVTGDRETYYVTEKGTDVNLTAHLLTKGFMNAYDVAVVISGDTDYIPVIEILNTFGKSVIVVGIDGQNLSKFKRVTDRQVYLDERFFATCTMPQNRSDTKSR